MMGNKNTVIRTRQIIQHTVHKGSYLQKAMKSGVVVEDKRANKRRSSEAKEEERRK